MCRNCALLPLTPQYTKVCRRQVCRVSLFHCVCVSVKMIAVLWSMV